MGECAGASIRARAPDRVAEAAGIAVSIVAWNVEPGVVRPLIDVVFALVRPALRALVTPLEPVATNRPPWLTNAWSAAAAGIVWLGSMTVVIPLEASVGRSASVT